MKTAGIILSAAVVIAQAAAQETDVIRQEVREKLNAEITAQVNNTLTFVSGQIAGGKVVKAAPYSAEAVTESTQALADGNKIATKSSSMMYRDSEGRERREESIGRMGGLSADATPTKAVFISDPVAKVNYSLEPSAHTARKTGSGTTMTVFTTREPKAVTVSGSALTVSAGAGSYEYHTAGAVVGGGRSGGGDTPPNVEQLGSKMIEGVSAEGTRTTRTIPAGQIGNERDINIVSERWYSPELQMVVMTRTSDPRNGETVYRLTNISRSEPVPSLFEVPSDYTIVDNAAAHRVIIKDE
jgi:hypothetical protein